MSVRGASILLAAKCCQTAAVILVVLGLCIVGSAQTSTGRITGTVSDLQGQVIASAKVTVTNTATNVRWETSTRGDGTYQILDLPIGTYSVAVEAQGFAKTVTSPEALNINQSLRMEWVTSFPAPACRGCRALEDGVQSARKLFNSPKKRFGCSIQRT